MDLPSLFEMLVKNYGPQAGGYAVLLFIIFALARKYETAMKDRIEEGVKMALTTERQTEAIKALTEVIKDRRA